MIYHLWVIQYVLSNNVPSLQHDLISKEVQHTMKVSTTRIKPANIKYINVCRYTIAELCVQ